MATKSHIRLPFFLSALLASIISAQSVGSFYSATFLNGLPLSSSQISCSGMGQPEYCCGSGGSCAWDDAGKVACCYAQGVSCEGSAYGSNAGAAGQYYTSSSSVWNQQEQTTTVYKNVVPIVPVTVATVETFHTPTMTSYYTPSTSTYYPYSSPTTLVAAVVADVTSCSTGYQTLTEANVGAPTRTWGCYVLINGSVGRVAIGILMWALSTLAFIVGSLYS